MKKVILIFTVLVLFILSNATAQTVYITKTGKKYHTASCSYLKKSSIQRELSDVVGYAPCKRCNPPTNSANTNTDNEKTKKNTSVGTPSGTTATGKTIYTGPRGGQYHYSKSGKKVYHKRKK